MRDSAELIIQLGLQPHPEGGHFRETYKAEHQVITPRGPRAACTAILFLLRAGERSHWHRIHSDEIWHIHGGGPLVVHELNRSGIARSTHLGMDLAHGEQPQHSGSSAGHGSASAFELQAQRSGSSSSSTAIGPANTCSAAGLRGPASS